MTALGINHIDSAERRSMGELAYAELKRQIVEGELPPGSQWLEEELALRFGMSRTPIREALLRLEQDGFAVIVPRRGMRVAEMSRHDVIEVNEVLESLELVALRRVAARKLAPAEMARLDGAIAGMDRALETEDVLAWAKADYAFHRALVELAGNRHLMVTAANFLERAHRFRLSSLDMRVPPVASTTSHAATVEAIRRRDVETATEIYTLHKRRWARELTGLVDKLGLSEG